MKMENIHLKITNIAKNPINIQIEFGNTNSQKNASIRNNSSCRCFNDDDYGIYKNKKLQNRAT